jgi:Xaa-Pro aminopeptidase
VFSIEPGIYLPSFGGIRIENLCTLTQDKKRPGFLRVEPLTFSPLDARLIETKLLTPAERAWLAGYSKSSGAARARKRFAGHGHGGPAEATRRAS